KLAQAVGGNGFYGFIAAVTFATILAVVAGLTLAGATTISHDLYAQMWARGKPDERLEMRISRAATIGLSAVAIGLSILFEHVNVAFMVGLVAAVAASANFPVLAMSIFWRGMTTRGAVLGGGLGLVSAVALTVLSKSVWVDVLHHAHAPVFLDNPALVSVPLAFVGIVLGSLADRGERARRERRRHERGRDAVELRLRDRVRAAVEFDDLPEFLFHIVDVALPLGLHEDLDAGLVLVVATAVAVVHAHDRLDVVHHVLPRQERAQQRRDRRRAAHPAADAHAKAERARVVAHQPEPDVVPVGRRAVLDGARDRDLELARQEREFGVQRGPLAHHFGERARIGDLVGRDARAFVARDVADAVAARLDPVHVDGREQVHHVGRLRERYPVELHVGARREVRVAGRQAQRAEPRLRIAGGAIGGVVGHVVVARDAGQHAQLRARQRAIRHGDAQHRRVALHVPAVLQAQRPERVFTEGAALPAFELVAKLGGAAMDERPVEIGISIHDMIRGKRGGARGARHSERRLRLASGNGRQRRERGAAGQAADGREKGAAVRHVCGGEHASVHARRPITPARRRSATDRARGCAGRRSSRRLPDNAGTVGRIRCSG
ncbi:acetate permease, partial [Burkholderia sp. TJI49]